MSLSRRSFFANLAATAGLPALGASKKVALRPNIVLIAVDNLGSWMLGAYGNHEVRTPNLDTLARAGTRFTNSYAAAPSASESLPSLLTGRNTRQLGEGKKSLDAEVLVSDILAGQGYTCGYAGRWAGGAAAKPGHGYAYSSADPAVAVDFIGQQKSGKPFFLTLAYPLLSTSPDARYEAMYSKSAFLETVPRQEVAANARNKEALKDVVTGIRKSAAALTALDDQVGALVKALRAANLRDNTLIIVTGNAGFLMGQHGLWGDGSASEPGNMYDEVTKVATFWNWPGKIPVEMARPEVTDAHDLAPTLCDL
ncbi:MAG: sulfatase-like hydrolase/transferase, partial [Acidobacteria bacterium]|nr:sulfatase-like hydrolase/transferase [Acidobacteriota bacterium]